jgi:transglutaminase-like putative cysteine protease
LKLIWEDVNASPMVKYLASSTYIDFDHYFVAEKAIELAAGHQSDTLIAQSCYEFVRDAIKHSWDYRQNPVTCKASDVLIHGTGYCFAKSHLLAALLRANNIPAGLCYQRLTIEKEGALYSLHGLNAVYLKEYGWYRIDPRGNKPGVEAEFCPPVEKLAFQILGTDEGDFLEIWPEPLPLVVEVLTAYKTVEQVYQHLPDIEILKRKMSEHGIYDQ